MKKKPIIILSVIIFLLVAGIFLTTTYSTIFGSRGKWERITILAGRHSYYHSFHILYDVDDIEFYFKTNDTWYYDEPERNGWNKIHGFSFGNHHDQSSARLVYKCVDDTLLLVGGYCWVDGVKPDDGVGQQAIIDTIEPNKTYHCRIKYEDGKFKFYFEDKYWECKAGQRENWGYLLEPYIGGVFTLDHDWYIDIKDIPVKKKERFSDSTNPKEKK